MRIGIDARFYGPIGKGLGRYTQKLIENLEKIDEENQYFIFLRKENFAEYQPKNKNFQKVLADFKWYGFAEQFRFPRLLKKYDLDLVHFAHFNVPVFYFGRFIVTIHDLILLNFPTMRATTLSPFWYRIKFLAYKLAISSAVHRSSRIIAVSRFTKKDILENYPRIPQEKIIVTHEACDDFCMLSPNKDKEILARYDVSSPYIMYVGNAYPHKNLENLVLAFAKMSKKRPELQLVLVGKEDYFYKKLKLFVDERGIEKIVFLGYVNDYELDTFFHNASVYVFPSLYEGFGLPPLEAMSKGAPVASSDHPCMKEVLGESACYFDGKDTDDIARAVEDIFQKDDLRAELIRKGYEQVGRYSWKKMARETLGLYEKIHPVK